MQYLWPFVEINSLSTKVSFCLSDGQQWEGRFYLQPPACDRGGWPTAAGGRLRLGWPHSSWTPTSQLFGRKADEHMGSNHRLNMELYLQSELGSMCTAVLIGWDLATPLRIWAHVRGALLVSQDRRHLLVTPWFQLCIRMRTRIETSCMISQSVNFDIF